MKQKNPLLVREDEKHGFREMIFSTMYFLLFQRLSRSALHRCLQYYGISQIPEDQIPEELKIQKEKGSGAMDEIGLLHIDITEFWLEKKKGNLFVVIDRVSKCAMQKFFLKNYRKCCLLHEQYYYFFPYKITVFSLRMASNFPIDMIQAIQPKLKRHPFSALLFANTIKQKLTKFYHPQTNEQGERMNGTIKDQLLRNSIMIPLTNSLAHLLLF